MHHPTLGELIHDDSSGGLKTTVPWQDGVVRVCLYESDDSDAMIAFVNVVATLAKLEADAREIVLRDLYELYNDGWRCFYMGDEYVERPWLTVDEFLAKFRLETLAVSGTTYLELWYEHDGLFWDNAIAIISCEGMDLSKCFAGIHS